jgi:hypothetical protein
MMGTNFYWKIEGESLLPTGASIAYDRDEPTVHIGKRSAAGRFCWDCMRTLCLGGEQDIHSGRSSWNETCPHCGKPPMNEKFGEGAGGVELGFVKPHQERPTGVRSVASFSWAQDPTIVRHICENRPGDVLIENEYGDTFTGADFLALLHNNCPIEFTHSIGKVFC